MSSVAFTPRVMVGVRSVFDVQPSKELERSEDYLYSVNPPISLDLRTLSQ